MAKKMPEVAGELRGSMLQKVPEEIYTCSGISIFGKRIKSILFSTDVAVIRNTNADAVIAVYPFTPHTTIEKMSSYLDIPIVVTVVNHGTDYAARIAAGTAIFNVAAAKDTARIVADIRSQFPDFPIIATGGPTAENILETVAAGANAITWTPPSQAQIFAGVMAAYRKGKPHP